MKQAIPLFHSYWFSSPKCQWLKKKRSFSLPKVLIYQLRTVEIPFYFFQEQRYERHSPEDWSTGLRQSSFSSEY